MRLVFFGSGAFGLPTLTHLASRHDIALVVSQPDRPAGRRRQLAPTPIAAHAENLNLPIVKPQSVNDATTVHQIRALDADAWVVIAFGQKLGRQLLENQFAINLHGSLLPKYRGAAPINWAMISGERETGVSVIAVADRMDAGEIYAAAATTIDPGETAGELHDRLASLGPEVVDDVLQRHASGALIGQAQDERLASSAPKLTKADGTVRFDQSATAVRNRIHGLTPWPGCAVRFGDGTLRLHRAQAVAAASPSGAPGEVLEDYLIACAPGAIELLEVQPPGRDVMSFAAYRNGHAVRIGSRLETIE
jgi:methionyl-tRNA formyltransferase